MPGKWIPESVIGNNAAAVPQNQTDLVISDRFRIEAMGARVIRAELFVGQVVVGTAITFRLGTYSGYDFYNVVAKAGTAVSASAGVAVTSIATATDIFTTVAHGFTDGQYVGIVSTAALPGGTLNTKIYRISKLSDDTYKLIDPITNLPVDITSEPITGGATVTVTGLTRAVFTLQPEVAGDQSSVPLGTNGVVVITTGAGDTAQVLDAVIIQES